MGGAQLIGGRYRLLERLGIGGMSVVWRGYDEVLGRDVAVKVLAPRLAGDQNFRQRLRVEAQAAGRLCHPHITTVYDYGESTTASGVALPYVVMELVDGESMADRLADDDRLPWRVAVAACAQVASALSAAHARGIVHRDVTPGNVMLTSGGAKVVDFGISALAGATDVDPAGSLLGTPAYLAPERLDGGPVEPASDVYGLGLLLYKSITGRLPWPVTNTTQMLKAHRQLEPPVIAQVPGLPQEIVQLCRRCLAKRPEDRPSSEEAARTLAEIAGLLVPLPPREQEPTPRSWQPPARLPGRHSAESTAWMAAADTPESSIAPVDPASVGSPSASSSADEPVSAGPVPIAPGLVGPVPVVPGPSSGGPVPVEPGLVGPSSVDPVPVVPGAVGPSSAGVPVLASAKPAALVEPARRAGPAGPGPAATSMARRHRSHALLIAAGLLLLFAAGAWAAAGQPGPRSLDGASGSSGMGIVAQGAGVTVRACQVEYHVSQDWGNGFVADLALTNQGSTALRDWRLVFTFEGDQRINSGHSASWQQADRTVVARPSGAGGRLDPGQTQQFGFTASYRTANPLPVAFNLNGAACQTVIVGADGRSTGGTAAGAGTGTQSSAAPK
jgi:serine/threonine-protein kinase